MLKFHSVFWRRDQCGFRGMYLGEDALSLCPLSCVISCWDKKCQVLPPKKLSLCWRSQCLPLLQSPGGKASSLPPPELTDLITAKLCLAQRWGAGAEGKARAFRSRHPGSIPQPWDRSSVQARITGSAEPAMWITRCHGRINT